MEGDVIGCGVDFDDEIIFFTKNGVLAGVATFTSYNIERSAKLFISVAYDHPPSGISINAGNSPFQWNPRGKDGHIHRLAIPRSFFDVYGAFYVAGTSWMRENEGIDVSCDGRELRKSKGLTLTSDSEPVIAQLKGISMSSFGEGIFYYEVEVVHCEGSVATGYGYRSSRTEGTVRAVHNSWGYNSDGLVVSHGNPLFAQYGPKCHSGDIIGCGLVLPLHADRGGSIFYTINGSFLGIFFDNVYHDLPTTCLQNVAIARTGYYYDVLIPSVSLCHPTDAVRANFGHEPFRYPIGRIMRDSSRKTQWPRSPKPQSLPSEVISTILKFSALAPRKEGIAWSALVCRYWYRRCLPYLFKSITLRSKSDMDILYALVKRPRTHILGPSNHHLALEEMHSGLMLRGLFPRLQQTGKLQFIFEGKK